MVSLKQASQMSTDGQGVLQEIMPGLLQVSLCGVPSELPSDPTQLDAPPINAIPVRQQVCLYHESAARHAELQVSACRYANVSPDNSSATGEPGLAVVNIGRRPTYGDSPAISIEAHVLKQYSEDFYGKLMRLTLHGFIR